MKRGWDCKKWVRKLNRAEEGGEGILSAKYNLIDLCLLTTDMSLIFHYILKSEKKIREPHKTLE